jgi:hypothetical protein
LSNCKQDARKNRKQTKTVKILLKELHFKGFVYIKFSGQESEPLGTQIYTQLVNRPHFGMNSSVWAVWAVRAVREKSGSEEF